MNKVFEVIEAKNFLKLIMTKLILTHPKSYLHAIIKFNNGLIKLLIHEPDMKIPISNSIYYNIFKNDDNSPVNFEILNNLNLKKIDINKFPLIKILNGMPRINSLYETVLITINDYFVFKFLQKKINFKELINLILKYSSLKEFQKYKQIKPQNAHEIYKLRDYVSLKLSTLGI